MSDVGVSTFGHIQKVMYGEIVLRLPTVTTNRGESMRVGLHLSAASTSVTQKNAKLHNSSTLAKNS